MFRVLKLRFEPLAERFISSEAIKPVLTGRITREEYQSVLRQIFHHTRENPQLQALATVYFRGRQRDLVRAFFSHAASEIGHDQLALNDFTTLGGNPSSVPYENPLPATTALISFGFYQIYNLNPLGYLGYLFFLEFIGTQAGGRIIDALVKGGIPETATTFLRDHTEVDVGHNKLMEKYVAGLVVSEADVDAVTYAMSTTAYLYEQMIYSAIQHARLPQSTGWNWEELIADSKLPEHLSVGVA